MNADANSFEQWQAEGAKDAAARANERWKALLSDYRQPPLGPAVDEALAAYIAERKAAMPDLSYG